jgi:hypothetical protein
MNMIERRQAERRADSLRDWRAAGRRAADKKRLDNARIAHWFAIFDAARRVNS